MNCAPLALLHVPSATTLRGVPPQLVPWKSSIVPEHVAFHPHWQPFVEHVYVALVPTTYGCVKVVVGQATLPARATQTCQPAPNDGVQSPVHALAHSRSLAEKLTAAFELALPHEPPVAAGGLYWSARL